MSKPISIPIDPNHKLGEAEEDIAVDREMYQRLVGRLIYLFGTRPDITYVVSVISQFMHSLKEVHCKLLTEYHNTLRGLQERASSLNVARD